MKLAPTTSTTRIWTVSPRLVLLFTSKPAVPGITSDRSPSTIGSSAKNTR